MSVDEKRCLHCKCFLPKTSKEIKLKKTIIVDENFNVIGYCCIRCLYKYYLGENLYE